MPRKKITVALSAIPNTGKTTLFNRLTGANQSTGNWPGVSVEKKSGLFTLGEYDIELIDLPGAYSLSPVTEEEKVVRRFFLETPPDIVLNILDARNLYRGLGLTLQMALSGLPMLVAVNMMDEAEKLGLAIDLQVLAEHLGVPVIGISARTGEGIPELEQALYQLIKSPRAARPPHLPCPVPVEEAIRDLAKRMEQPSTAAQLDRNFLAMRLLESGDQDAPSTDRQLLAHSQAWREKITRATGESVPVVCAACRFNAARGLVMEATHQRPPLPDRFSQRLDQILLHRWLGLPLFLLIMLLAFQGVYGLGAPLQDALSAVFSHLEDALRQWPVVQSLPKLVESLLFDGLWQGLSVVTSFFPIIALFFVFMSLIEDSGYMARAAFLMDRLMHRLGLDGKAFINLLLGYGCNVPAVMGTRILSSRHNRWVTMLLIPFTLCSARLQVFVFLASILFSPRVAPWILFALYAGSVGAIFLLGLFLKCLRIGGEPEPFIMEIPPYRIPTLRSVLLRTRQELLDFLYRAATLILVGVVLVWALTQFPPGVETASPASWAGQLGSALAPLFTPLGIAWEQTIALMFGFIAKEIVIGALAVIYPAGDLTAQIASHVTPLEGLSFMVFTLLYTPCIATLAAIRAESRSWSLTLFSLLLGLVTAWIASFCVYQIGLLMGY